MSKAQSPSVRLHGPAPASLTASATARKHVRVHTRATSRTVAVFLFLALCLALPGGCATRQSGGAQEQPAFFLPGGAPISEADLIARLGQADFILVGERHNSPEDHLAQARLLQLAAQSGRPPVVGLEMLPRHRHDAALDDLLHGRVSLENLPSALDWKKEWGFDFALYEPIFAVARDLRLPLYGLNIDNALRKKAGQKGVAALSAEEKSRLPKAIALPLPEQRRVLAQIFSLHAGGMEGAIPGGEADAIPGGRTGNMAGSPSGNMTGGNTAAPNTAKTGMHIAGGREGSRPGMPGKGERTPVRTRGKAMPGAPAARDREGAGNERFERFMLVQSLWDGVMAGRALELHQASGRPVVILAGGGHVEYGHGIAYRLRLSEPKARILSVMPFSGPPAEARGADLFFASPEPPSRQGYGLTFAQQDGPPIVASVRPGSAADKAGIRAGDSVTAVNGRVVNNTTALHFAAAGAARSRQPLDLTLTREGREVLVKLPAP